MMDRREVEQLKNLLLGDAREGVCAWCGQPSAIHFMVSWCAWVCDVCHQARAHKGHIGHA